MKKRIGILGGTFDPIHNGHIRIALESMKVLKLDEVLLIPTGTSYMKTDVTEAWLRYRMVCLAASLYDGLKVEDVEFKREGNTYTCDTLAYLKEKYPESELFFITGTDTIFSMEKWKNASYVFQNCKVVCCNRSGEYGQKPELQKQYLEKTYNADIIFIPICPIDISSTDIRNFRRDNPLNLLEKLELPEIVKDYILRMGLYTDFDEIRGRIQKLLKPKRYLHTLGVIETATKLAEIYGCDVEKARMTALLHDCAKYMPEKDKMEICAKYGVCVSEIEKKNTELLHGKAGALFAKEQFRVSDDITDAIFYHTTGNPDMSLLTQIIFVADYIEPGRNHISQLPELRKLAETDINKATAQILHYTLSYLNQQPSQNIDPMTADTFEYYKRFL